MDATDSERAALRLVARGGLCGDCTHARLVKSARGSLFLLCSHPDPPKYPPQPRLRCSSHLAR